jgi:hypothetical protein
MKTFIDNEWDESCDPPKRPKFIKDITREGQRIQDKTEKRIANFMLECKSEIIEEGKA